MSANNSGVRVTPLPNQRQILAEGPRGGNLLRDELVHPVETRFLSKFAAKSGQTLLRGGIGCYSSAPSPRPAGLVRLKRRKRYHGQEHAQS